MCVVVSSFISKPANSPLIFLWSKQNEIAQEVTFLLPINGVWKQKIKIEFYIALIGHCVSYFKQISDPKSKSSPLKTALRILLKDKYVASHNGISHDYISKLLKFLHRRFIGVPAGLLQYAGLGFFACRIRDWLRNFTGCGIQIE